MTALVRLVVLNTLLLADALARPEQADAAMSAQVVIAAGGLGTRVGEWTHVLPKEFQPVDGRPAIVWLLDEIAALSPADVECVYHPYYEPFIGWAARTLRRRRRARCPGPGLRAAAAAVRAPARHL
ncbi:hypothetical protein HC028_26255 [Planosporangium flavigriseum]|uniref:MobA-like NTP transferase domain-containing protein n=1 Tax=Planosporangium flavigriseum TaxID=373681 RepID=A0A8J3LU71_9ACTN|nr:NTP transferase domain-containing protein [Planosporangium flavigriseum]NJC67982.1 hypothetical protein [Planosporangium flavigriseum]GIG76618.1 hypothetical protein Pfl04_50220 [Planosporangium flavigriseum]